MKKNVLLLSAFAVTMLASCERADTMTEAERRRVQDSILTADSLKLTAQESEQRANDAIRSQNEMMVQQQEAQVQQLADSYQAQINGQATQGYLMLQRPNETTLQPARVIGGQTVVGMPSGSIVVMANGTTAPIRLEGNKMMMTMPDSTTREVVFKNNQMTIAGKAIADGKMAVMNNGQMMDVRMTGGKLLMSMPDNSMTEIKITDGQIVMVPDTKNTTMMMQMPDGTKLPVTMKNGKLMVVMPDSTTLEMTRKP
jgi:hypothetical protein